MLESLSKCLATRIWLHLNQPLQKHALNKPFARSADCMCSSCSVEYYHWLNSHIVCNYAVLSGTHHHEQKSCVSIYVILWFFIVGFLTNLLHFYNFLHFYRKILWWNSAEYIVKNVESMTWNEILFSHIERILLRMITIAELSNVGLWPK